jgi:hypothetical protein
MIGRIDLITPEHRDIAERYNAMPSDQKNSPEGKQLLQSLGRFAYTILRQPAAPTPPLGSAR